MKPEDLRDSVVPLPSREDGYHRVLMLGTTGAGKTTVVRQLLGTHPKTERFPSTSTAKTTVADTEIIPVDEPEFRAAVTFLSRDEVEEFLLQNVDVACREIVDGADDARVFQKLLDHEGQRFRLSYMLGRPVVEDDDVIDDDDLIDDDVIDVVPHAEPIDDEAGLPDVDVAASRRIVEDAVAILRGLVGRIAPELRLDVDDDEDDGPEDAFYVSLHDEVMSSGELVRVIDMLVEQVRARFRALREGEISVDDEGWPTLWSHTSTDRHRFLRTLTAFYGNSAAHFGRLLSPVVNGIRVSGPFVPTWGNRPLRLILIDSEGLGHSPSSISSLSTSLVQKVAACDAVLLVDNAQQPMLAGPMAAMTQIVETGNVSKLHVLFTHLDGVTGANLSGYAARIQHVRESVDNGIREIEASATPSAARALSRRARDAVFFAGRLDRVLTNKDIFGRKGTEELTRLAEELEGEEPPRELGDAEVVISRKGVVLAVREATARFQRDWLVRLGAKRSAPGTALKPEHWSRVKALNRRIALGRAEEYDSLKPVADFRRELQAELYGMLRNPVRWRGQEVDAAEQEEIVDTIANALNPMVVELAQARVVRDRLETWTTAYGFHGPGSTVSRATMLADEVVRASAPELSSALAGDAADLVRQVEGLLDMVQVEHKLVIE